MALEQWTSAKVRRGTTNGIMELSQRAPPIFSRAAITLGIGPHSRTLSLLWPAVLTPVLITLFSHPSQNQWRPQQGSATGWLYICTEKHRQSIHFYLLVSHLCHIAVLWRHPLSLFHTDTAARENMYSLALCGLNTEVCGEMLTAVLACLVRDTIDAFFIWTLLTCGVPLTMISTKKTIKMDYISAKIMSWQHHSL